MLDSGSLEMHLLSANGIWGPHPLKEMTGHTNIINNYVLIELQLVSEAGAFYIPKASFVSKQNQLC